jgi:uncharacterized damage-inducible protein DinB
MATKTKKTKPKSNAKRAANAKKPARKAAKRGAAGPGFSAKQQFLDTFMREHAITLKVLRAFPAEQAGFRPHERSNSARDLAWTFAGEQKLITKCLTDVPLFSGGMPKAPDDFKAIVDQFDREFNDVVALIKRTPESKFNETIQFMIGPGQMADFTKMQIAWLMLTDQIHHRGQMSVYLRMAGGKVPSIYGPSADEPWR